MFDVGKSPAVCWVQWVPSQVQVSLTWVGAFAGSVTSTISPRSASHAIEEPPAGGPRRRPLSISCQVLPFHAQVSLAPGPAASQPPKSRTTFASGSYAGGSAVASRRTEVGVRQRPGDPIPQPRVVIVANASEEDHLPASLSRRPRSFPRRRRVPMESAPPSQSVALAGSPSGERGAIEIRIPATAAAAMIPTRTTVGLKWRSMPVQPSSRKDDEQRRAGFRT